MVNLPELNFDSPAPAQPDSQPDLPEIRNDVWEMVDKVPEELSSKASPSKWKSLVAGADAGVDAINKVIVGAPLKLLSKTGFEAPYKWNKAQLDKREADRKEAMEANPKTAAAGKFGLEFAATLPFTAIKGAYLGAKAIPYVGKGVYAATQALKQGTATGALLADSDDPTDIAKSAAITGAISAPLGAVTRATGVLPLAGAGVGAGSAYLADKDVATGALAGFGAGLTVKGAVKGGGALGKKMVRGMLDPQAEQITKLAQDAGVPLTVTDIMKSSVAKQGLELTFDSIPVIGFPSLRTAQVAKHKPIVDTVIKQVAKESDGTLPSVQEAILANEKKMHDGAKVLFDRVKEIDNGMGRISLDNVKNVAQAELKSSQLGLKVDSELKSNVEALMGKGSKINFEEARAIRTSLSSTIRKLDKGAVVGSADENTIRQLNIIKNSLDDAIDNFGVNGSNELVQAYSKAKTAYKAYSDVFKNNPEARRALADSGILENWIRKAATEKNSVRAAQYQAALGEEGQAANRAYVLKDALRQSIDEPTQRFNPEQFLGIVQKSPNSAFGNQIEAVKGMNKLLKFTSRAAALQKNQILGSASIPLVGAFAGTFGTYAYFNPEEAAAVSVPIAILGAVMKRPQLFINAAKLSERTNPSVWNYMSKALLKTMTNVGITEGSQAIQEAPQQAPEQQ